MVIELYGRTGDNAGVYLKGGYEEIKSAYDSSDNLFTILRVSSRIDGEQPAMAVTMGIDDLTLQANGAFTYGNGVYEWWFYPYGVINANGADSQ